MYHFVLILLGEIVTPFSAALLTKLGIRQENRLLRLFRILRTGLLVVIGELFFRANGLRAGLAMFSKMVTDFSFTLPKGSLLSKLRVDPQDLLIVFVTLAIGFHRQSPPGKEDRRKRRARTVPSSRPVRRDVRPDPVHCDLRRLRSRLRPGGSDVREFLTGTDWGLAGLCPAHILKNFEKRDFL